MSFAPTAQSDSVLFPDALDPEPGLVLVHAGGRPRCSPLPIKEPLELGRSLPGGEEIADDRISRHHARVSFREGAFWIEDLKSRNGTFLNGARVSGGPVAARPPSVLRLGHALFLAVPDTRIFQRAPVVEQGGLLVGPTLQRVLDHVARAAAHVESVLIGGESGAGKELAAHAFHRAGPSARGPFVAINAAAVPEGVAERLLFGSKRGAFSGAEDAEGYLQTADGGVLFLDEVAELSPAVQAKLLRVLQTKEVLPLGAARPRKVNVRIVAATHVHLRTRVEEGRFRADLFYRLSQAEVRVPPLRERREEIPWLVARAAQDLAADLSLHGRFVEACLLRAWPGNVRELLSAVRAAGVTAQTQGRSRILPEDLPAEVGARLAPSAAPSAAPSSNAKGSEPPPVPPTPSRLDELTAGDEATTKERAELERALAEVGGNVAELARKMGLHRTQLYRLLRRFGLR